jgi:hypothetical protein
MVGIYTRINTEVTTEYEGFAQGFDGLCLYNPNFPNYDHCGKFIYEILQVLEIDDWKDLIGKAIGHFIKDNWNNI